MKLPTIFLVEDNPDDVELTRMALDDNNIKVELEVAVDGAQALERLTEDKIEHIGSWPPHVILLDLNLPKISGLEVLRHLKRDPVIGAVPVIMLTTSDDEFERLDCYNEGAASFIRKPVAFERFLEVIHQLGIYWLDINVPSQMSEKMS